MKGFTVQFKNNCAYVWEIYVTRILLNTDTPSVDVEGRALEKMHH